MTLDSKALEAAHESYSTHGQTGDLRRQRISDDLMSAVITAYLSTATPADVVGLVERLKKRALAMRGLSRQTVTTKYDADLSEEAASTLLSLSARCGEMEKISDDLMSDLQDAIEADMGRELRDRDLPRSWHRARAALSRRATTGGE